MSWKFEQKKLKNEQNISLLVTPETQKARTEIIAILWNYGGFLALK